jgi:cell division septal protein FtsQ
MWFKSKATNRRFERDHVLDVKMRARQIRTARVRLVAKVAGVLFGTASALCLFWFGSGWVLNEKLYKNPAFSIKHLDVETDGVLAVDQILAWAGVKRGDNLLAADLPRIERDLRLQPLVENAAVVRVLPDTLKIRVTEREAIAQIFGFQAQLSGDPIKAMAFYMDPAGYVMTPLAPSHASNVRLTGAEALPVLTGVLGTELRPGKRAESADIHAALRFILAFDRSPMIGAVDIKLIDLSSPPTLQVTTRQGNEVILAPEDFDRQLRRWRAIHDFAAHEAKLIGSLDLSVSNNIPLRWQEPGAPVPPPAKGLKLARSRKKHV